MWFLIIQQSPLNAWYTVTELAHKARPHPHLGHVYVNFSLLSLAHNAYFLVFMSLQAFKVPLQRLDIHVFQYRLTRKICYYSCSLHAILVFVHLLVLLCLTVFGYSRSSLCVVIYPFSRFPL